MATWVEDIIQALQNLGGQAPLREIYVEVKRIRKNPLPKSYTACIRERIESHSSDSKNFKGRDFFKKVEKGVWALRDVENFPDNTRRNQNIKTKMMPSKDYAPNTSFEEISNLFKTIKQYREFANPNDLDVWTEYVYEIFHIFGFGTKSIAPHLISLHAMGSEKDIKALVCLVEPNKDFHSIVPGFDNQSYLFFASKHHQVPWAILTNGLIFKAFNFSNNFDNQKKMLYKFDKILKYERIDSFFSIYKLFTLIGQWNSSNNE